MIAFTKYSAEPYCRARRRNAAHPVDNQPGATFGNTKQMRFSTYQQLHRNFYHCALGIGNHPTQHKHLLRQAKHRRASHDLELRR
jgi:hypothetical protein